MITANVFMCNNSNIASSSFAIMNWFIAQPTHTSTLHVLSELRSHALTSVELLLENRALWLVDTIARCKNLELSVYSNQLLAASY